MVQTEYVLMPVSFEDTAEMMQIINQLKDEGYRFICKMYEHEDSPWEGVTTIDFLVERPVVSPDKGKTDEFLSGVLLSEVPEIPTDARGLRENYLRVIKILREKNLLT